MSMQKRIAARKSVAVKFIGDEDFIENITNLKDKTSGKKKADIIYDQSKADDIPLGSSDDDYQAPSGLYSSVEEANGRSPLCKTKISASSPRGAKKIEKLNVSSPVHTPRATRKSGGAPKYELKSPKVESPYQLRHSARTAVLQDIKDCFSDPEDSNSDISDDSDYAPDTEASHNQNGCLEKNSVNFAEEYFAAHRASKSNTSNRTMSKVEVPKTSIPELQKILQNAPEYHTKQQAALYKSYEKMFPKWLFLLREGFNVLLYGIGSKISLLQNFTSKCLSESLCIVINGFYPAITIKQVLNSITESIIKHEGTFSNLFDQVDFIVKHFESENEDLYLIINTIDAVPLRCAKLQTILSSLASSSKIHLVASVDHINCSLIWDQIMLSKFCWTWHHVPTYEPYILETSYESSLLQDKSNRLLLSSLVHVFNSLTPNNQGVFLILAKYQQEKKDSGNYSGITFHDWYQDCREAFLVNSKATMNAQMSEFKNHKLLASRKSTEGIECWYIPVDEDTLAQFLERCDS